MTKKLRRTMRNDAVALASTLALVLATALPAAAASSSGWKDCASTQQYGTGFKNSTRPGVSDGGWEAYTPAPATFLNANGTCGPKTA